MENSHTYLINKGVGKTVEFKGLKSQYLIAFFGGIFVLLMLFMILAAFGVGFIFNTILILSLGSALLYYVFVYNKKYGEHGLMKLSAYRRVPKHLSRTNTYRHILSTEQTTNEPSNK